MDKLYFVYVIMTMFTLSCFGSAISMGYKVWKYRDLDAGMASLFVLSFGGMMGSFVYGMEVASRTIR